METTKQETNDKIQEKLDNQAAKLKPKTINFHRTKSDGDYGSIRFGGEYEIPEGMSKEQALTLIMNETNESVEKYLDSVRTSYPDKWDERKLKSTLENLTQEINDFTSQYLTDQEEHEKRIDRSIVKSKIRTLESLLNQLQSLEWKLNQKIETIHRTLDQILENTEYTLEELEMDNRVDFTEMKYRLLSQDRLESLGLN